MSLTCFDSHKDAYVLRGTMTTYIWFRIAKASSAAVRTDQYAASVKNYQPLMNKLDIYQHKQSRRTGTYISQLRVATRQLTVVRPVGNAMMEVQITNQSDFWNLPGLRRDEIEIEKVLITA